MTDQICLVVDDEPSIRRCLRTILETQSLQVLEADNAAQALGIVQKLNGSLDLIITDITMPGEMDGLDLANSIRNSFPNVPVILISGYFNEESIKRGNAVFEFVQKPFTTEAILKAARRAMTSRRLNPPQTAINE